MFWFRTASDFLVITGFTQGLSAQDKSKVGELIVPIVVNGSLGPTSQFATSFTFLHVSSTTSRITAVVLDDKGKRSVPFCPGPGPAPAPDIHVFDLTGDAMGFRLTSAAGELFSGWMYITHDASARIEATAELVLIKAPPLFCPPVICTRPSTEKLADVRVSAVRPAREFRLEAIRNRNRHSAYAIVNPSETQAAKVEFSVFDPLGQLVKTTKLEISARNRVAAFLEPLSIADIHIVPPKIIPDDFHGSVKVTSDIPVAVGGVDVLFPEGKLVNLPAARLDETK